MYRNKPLSFKQRQRLIDNDRAKRAAIANADAKALLPETEVDAVKVGQGKLRKRIASTKGQSQPFTKRKVTSHNPAKKPGYAKE